MSGLAPNRRDELFAPLLAAGASSLGIGAAQAAGVDPAMTIVVPPDKIPWQPLYNFPQGASEQATMFGSTGEAGQYFVLIRWHPGFMSAPALVRDRPSMRGSFRNLVRGKRRGLRA